MSEEDSTKGISRRDFIKGAAVIGARAVVLNGIVNIEALAETAKEAPTPGKQPYSYRPTETISTPDRSRSRYLDFICLLAINCLTGGSLRITPRTAAMAR